MHSTFYHFNQEYVLLAKLKVHWRFFQLHKHFSKLRLHRKEVSPKIIIHINQSTNLEAALHLLCHCAIQTGWQMLTHTANTQDVLFSAPGKVTRKSFAASIEHILYTPFWVCAFPRVSLFCAWRVDWRGLGGGQWPWLGPHLVETIFQSLLFLIVNCLSPCPLFALGQLQLEATQQEVEWEVLRRSLPHPTVPETLSVQSCLEFIHGPMSKLWSCVGCTRHNLRQDVSQAEFGSRVHWILLSLHMCHKFQSCRWNSRERERERDGEHHRIRVYPIWYRHQVLQWFSVRRPLQRLASPRGPEPPSPIQLFGPQTLTYSWHVKGARNPQLRKGSHVLLISLDCVGLLP